MAGVAREGGDEGAGEGRKGRSQGLGEMVDLRDKPGGWYALGR